MLLLLACILLQFSTLSCYRLFFLKSFYPILFRTEKVCKRSRHRSRQSNEALLVSTRLHSVASFFPLLSLRSKFGNGVTRFSRINSNKPFHRSNIPRSISSFLANNNYDSQQCRFVFKVTPARVFKRDTTTQANHCNKVRYLKTASIIGAYWSFSHSECQRFGETVRGCLNVS